MPGADTAATFHSQPNKNVYDEKENILNQVFTSNKKNKVWVGDITYIPTKHGWLYPAVFIDIFSRKVTGWAMDTRVRDTLILSALNEAIGREHPEVGAHSIRPGGSKPRSVVTASVKA